MGSTNNNNGVYTSGDLFMESFNQLYKIMADNSLGDSIDEYTSDEDEYDLCLKQAEKYVKSKDMTKEGAYQKLVASLARKGFEFDMIKQVSKKVLSAEDAEKIDNME